MNCRTPTWDEANHLSNKCVHKDHIRTKTLKEDLKIDQKRQKETYKRYPPLTMNRLAPTRDEAHHLLDVLHLLDALLAACPDDKYITTDTHTSKEIYKKDVHASKETHKSEEDIILMLVLTTHISQRPTKQRKMLSWCRSSKRDIQQRRAYVKKDLQTTPAKETCKRNLQKRPAKESYRQIILWTG